MTSPPDKTITYAYDSVGQRRFMVEPNGGRFTYGYDPAGQIEMLVNPFDECTTFGYDDAGRRTDQRQGNGTRASYRYAAGDNLTLLANLKSDGSTISSFDYGYDRVGNRTRVLEATGDLVTWTYDPTYQLTGERRSGANGYVDTFTYDPSENRMVRQHVDLATPGLTATTYTYDAANQIRYSQEFLDRTTYSFDANGNQQLVVEPNGGRTTTTWNFENKPTEIRQPSGAINTYTYNGDNIRVQFANPQGATRFVFDDLQYLAETDSLGNMTVLYTNEPNVHSKHISQNSEAETHWLHYDVLGSTRELSDSSAAVTDSLLYDAWGSPLVRTGVTRLLFTFVGEHGYLYESDLGGYYVLERSYEPNIARWTARDPLAVGDAAFLGAAAIRGAYAYASNNPTNLIDPSGLGV